MTSSIYTPLVKADAPVSLGGVSFLVRSTDDPYIKAQRLTEGSMCGCTVLTAHSVISYSALDYWRGSPKKSVSSAALQNYLSVVAYSHRDASLWFLSQVFWQEPFGPALAWSELLDSRSGCLHTMLHIHLCAEACRGAKAKAGQ